MQHRQERAKQQSCSSTWCQLIHLCTGCQQTRYWLCMTIVSSHMQRGNSTQSWPVHRCTTSNQPLNVGDIASSSCRMERTTHTLRTYPVIEGLSLAPTEQAKVRGGLALKPRVMTCFVTSCLQVSSTSRLVTRVHSFTCMASRLPSSNHFP